MPYTIEQITGADGEREYAYTRAVDHNTGDYILRGATWKGGNPQVERIYHTLATDIGSYAPDPTFGFRYEVLDHLTSKSPVVIDAEIRRALRYLVDDGSIKRLKIVSRIERARTAGGAFCETTISFYDPRSRRNITVKGRF